MQDKLKLYASGGLHYTPLLNIFLNNRSQDWYDMLGRYIAQNLDISKIPALQFLADKLKEQEGLGRKVKDFAGFRDRTYSSIGIFFLTGALEMPILKKMFGEPILHNEFGEGFEGEYNDETDEYGEPDIKESYASWFVTINGVDLHIGFDHRGTQIEVNIPLSQESNVPLETAQKTFQVMKGLVDEYKKLNQL